MTFSSENCEPTCDRAQGFLLSRPVVGDTMEALLAVGRMSVDFSATPRL
jgi:hypothetical protein